MAELIQDGKYISASSLQDDLATRTAHKDEAIQVGNFTIYLNHCPDKAGLVRYQVRETPKDNG